MSEEKKMKLPEYARHMHEVVRSIYLDAWIEETTKWLRIDVLFDLGDTYGPYSIRIHEIGNPSSEFLGGEYPFYVGKSPEEALEKCLEGLPQLACISRGIKSKASHEN